MFDYRSVVEPILFILPYRHFSAEKLLIAALKKSTSDGLADLSQLTSILIHHCQVQQNGNTSDLPLSSLSLFFGWAFKHIIAGKTPNFCWKSSLFMGLEAEIFSTKWSFHVISAKLEFDVWALMSLSVVLWLSLISNYLSGLKPFFNTIGFILIGGRVQNGWHPLLTHNSSIAEILHFLQQNWSNKHWWSNLWYRKYGTSC